MHNVTEVNNNDHYIYEIKAVFLFGSFIINVLEINDIDIAISIDKKQKFKENWTVYNELRIKQAKEKSKKFNSFMAEISYTFDNISADR